jgi:hypothetical protein
MFAVSEFEPHEDAGDHDHGGEMSGGLLIAGGYAPMVFDATKEVLNDMAAAIAMCNVGALLFAGCCARGGITGSAPWERIFLRKRSLS